MDANIYLAKSIIDGYRNHQFKRIYPFATENVAGCFSGYDFKDKDCLTVLGSSVQALYMYLMGAKKVTTFDINPLTIYYLHFQKAFFLSKMKFKDYKNMFHAFSFEDTKDTYNLDKYYKKISECLDGKYKVFWDTLYDEYGSYLFNTNGLFNPIECSCGSIDKYMGIYSSSNIRKLQSSIEYFEPEFINCNITELHKYLCQGYDFMYFSNIMQYSKSVFNSCDLKESLYKYKDLLISFKDLLNSGGSIYGSYIYGIDHINNVFVNSIDRVFGDTIDYKKFNVFGSGAFKTKDAVMVLGG
ncbi:MAG: hypothetical protein MSH29_01280 [Tenericutes bacterium]|nr:hypothetical protein [Mycoplasmatota bacterium]MDD7629583.1 hypothetical protein [bacterium]MDY4109196.1 hypothetical protein [Bacilli bacterium]